MPINAVRPLHVDDARRLGAIEALSAMATARIVTRESLITFAGPLGVGEAQLDVWVNVGMLHAARVPSGSLSTTQTTVLGLSLLGARELAHCTGKTVRGLSAQRFKRSGRKLLHDASMGDVALAFLAYGRDHPNNIVHVETDDRLLATSVVTQGFGRLPERVPLQPDGYVIHSTDHRQRGLLVELDRSTISTKNMLARYAAYHEWQRQRGPERTFHLKAMRLLTVVPDMNRLKALYRAALDATEGRHSGFFLFALQSDLTPLDSQRLAEPIGTVLNDTKQIPILTA